MKVEDYLTAFEDTQRKYFDYQLDWMKEHGYSIRDVGYRYVEYKKAQIDKEFPQDKLFDDYIAQYGMSDGKKDEFLTYGGWLATRGWDDMKKLSKKVDDKSLSEAIDAFYEKGYIGEDMYNTFKRIMKKYGDKKDA